MSALLLATVLLLIASTPVAVQAQDGSRVGTVTIRGMTLPYEVVEGLAVSGDIILGTVDEVADLASGRVATYGTHQDGSPCIWPDGLVPYVIDDDVRERDLILRAIREWDTRTVLRFVERAPQHADYLRFASGPHSGAWLCRDSTPGEQMFTLDNVNWEILLHGIGHAIGLSHEQQRKDRDQWVTVFSEDIAGTPYARGNWHPHLGAGVIGPYDYRSIMTYQAFGHGKRRNHARSYVMETIPPGMPFGGEALGASSELSLGDIDSVARLYGHTPSRHVIATNPPGLEIIVDGERMTAPASFAWASGSEHTLEVPSPQTRPGSRFLFGRWSDDGARAHTITATSDTTLYYANFIAQHQVSVAADGAGSVTVNPPSPDGYYTLRTPIEITATANEGSTARFLRWAISGDYWWDWYWTFMHGESSNPARTRVGPGLSYTASFVGGPIFRVESNVDPVPVRVNNWWPWTPIAFHVDELPSTVNVSPELIESRGRGYRHRFRSWSDGGDMAHSVEVDQDSDTTLTLNLDTEYRLDTHAWQRWENSVSAAPDSEDGFYPAGTEVRLRASGQSRLIGWNGEVSGSGRNVSVVMNDGQYVEAVFSGGATELRSGVPVQVGLRWQGADLEYGQLDFRRYYIRMPSDASELEVRFDVGSSTPGAAVGLWVADRDLWPNWVQSSDTADQVLRDGAAQVRVRRPGRRWPVAYMILVRAAESGAGQAHRLDGTLVAEVKSYRPPEPVGSLPNLILHASGLAVVDISRAFRSPDNDMLTYSVMSSAAGVAAAIVTGTQVTVMPFSSGSTTVTVTATNAGGATAVQQFTVVVTDGSQFTDHPIQRGTPIRAVHFLELRDRIGTLRARNSLPTFRWTDPVITTGATPVKRVHLTELRAALGEAFDAVGRPRPRYADTTLTAIMAVHLMELRTAVTMLESGAR